MFLSFRWVLSVSEDVNNISYVLCTGSLGLGPTRKILDMMSVMLKYQVVFVFGASWARVKARCPSLDLEKFLCARFDLMMLRTWVRLTIWKPPIFPNGGLCDRFLVMKR